MKLHLNGLTDEFGRVAALTAAIAGLALLPVATVTAQDDTVEVQALDDGSADDLSADGDSTQLGTIQVTGSRIKRTDFETAQPVLVVTREQIERTGLTTIGDILQEIPAAGSALNSTFNNGGNGATEIDLRNLGSNRVLVLVNGHRWVAGVSFANSSAVDLNTIPVSIIERIEVLKDGASAVYGSDAIAGVVNVITRKDFQGAAFANQVGGFVQGDGFTQRHTLSMGQVGRKTSVFVDFNFVKQDPVFAGDREISKVPQFGTGFTRGSIFTPRGTALFIPNAANGSILGTDRCPDLAGGIASGAIEDETGIAIEIPQVGVGGLQLCDMTLNPGDTITGDASETTSTVVGRYQPADRTTLNNDENDAYNFAPINYLRTPLTQTSIFAQLSHQLFSNVNLAGTFLYNRRDSSQELAETPLLLGDLVPHPYSQIYIAADQAFNPFDQDIGRYPSQGTDADQLGLGVGTGLIGRRFTELGPRKQIQAVDTYFLSGTLTGDFLFADRFFGWDAGYSYAVSQLTNTLRNNLNLGKVARALGPAAECGDPESPNSEVRACVPLNIFGGALVPEGRMTQEQLDYVRADLVGRARQRIIDYYANISTEVTDFGGLLYAPIGVALGVEVRDEKFTDDPDPLTTGNLSSGNNRRATAGGYDVSEAYIEMSIPLLSDIELAGFSIVQELDLSLAGRYTKYSLFEAEQTGKAGLRWKVFDDLLLRSTVSQAFRAPSVTELFLGGTDAFPTVADPCADDDPNDDVQANCDAEGPGTGVPQNNAQVLTTFGGNVNLTPEFADTFTAGIVYSPSYLPDFNVYFDYWQIDLDEFVGVPGPQFILDSCYGRPAGSPRPDTCDLDERNADGSLSKLNAAFINFARVRTRGVDFVFDYRIPFFKDLGDFKVTYDSQYLIEYDQFLPNADGTDSKAGFAGTSGASVLPRYKANLTLDWERGNWEASWQTRFIYHTMEACEDGLTPSLTELGLCSDPNLDDPAQSQNKVETTFYNDFQMGYSYAPWKAKFVFGIDNILDQDPPVSTSAFANSFHPTLYEIPGVQPYLRFDLSF